MNEQSNEQAAVDKHITCIECGALFLFSAGEQSYFISMLLSPPKRCPECRAERKAKFNARKSGEM